MGDDARATAERYAARVRGCLLGGAVGDALGAPVEFWTYDRIVETVGPAGVRTYLPAREGDDRLGLVTDDTQMTLFTVEGLIRAGVRRDRGLGLTVGVVHGAYDRWLDTQAPGGPPAGRRDDGWLIGQGWLHDRRAPGKTCLDALLAARGGADRPRQWGHAATNDSKGCGGVMRSAPFGLLLAPGVHGEPADVFGLAVTAAGYTHGHPTGTLSSGALAAAVGAIVRGADLDGALDVAAGLLRGHARHEETSAALTAARRAAASSSPPSAAAIAELGEGWVAEEALAMAVYAALAHPGPDEVLDALALAVSHGGDSDSTGAICGNLLGALHGDTALPPLLVATVEGRGTILELADDLVYEFTHSHEMHSEYRRTPWSARYPGM